MNFAYLEKFPKLNKLHSYCTEAEDLAVKYPAASCASARKAMEFIVKMIYASQVTSYDCGFTVFEMITDVRFVNYVNDPTLINSLHYIRKIGNIAAHGGSLSKDDSLKVLEELHFLVGEFCILIGLIDDYPEFGEPGSVPRKPIAEPAPASQKEKVAVEPELIALFAPRMRTTCFNVKHGRDEGENKKLFLVHFFP